MMMAKFERKTGKMIKKYACDRTLGHLAKWLRILGYDTIFWNNLDDKGFIEKSLEENRIILTRNTNLLKLIAQLNPENIPVFYFIPKNDVMDQLKHIVEKFHLTMENNLNICSKCNTTLEKIEKIDVENRVPEYVYETLKDFKKCGSCGNYYWRGTHVSRMLNRLKTIFNDSI